VPGIARCPLVLGRLRRPFVPRLLGPLYDLASQLGGELAELCQAGAAREDLFHALLRHVSEPGGLDVLVIEDVHWADEATIDLLRFLGRRLRDAVRSPMLTSPSWPAVAGLGSQPSTGPWRSCTMT
jgi:hypothetical protein